MTGRGHRWTGLGAALFAAAVLRLQGLGPIAELVAAAVALSSTTAPDWLEIPFYRNGARAGSIIPHRTITHWPPLWLAVIAWGYQDSSLVGAAAVGFAIGSLTHILADCPNPMGIPWVLPHRRSRIGKKGLWKSGQYEGLMTLSFTGLGATAFYSAANLHPF